MFLKKYIQTGSQCEYTGYVLLCLIILSIDLIGFFMSNWQPLLECSHSVEVFNLNWSRISGISRFLQFKLLRKVWRNFIAICLFFLLIIILVHMYRWWLGAWRDFHWWWWSCWQRSCGKGRFGSWSSCSSRNQAGQLKFHKY